MRHYKIQIKFIFSTSSKQAMETTRNSHLLVYPFPASGHIIPLIDLTHRLLRRGLTVTFLVTSNNLPLLHPLLSSPSFHHLVLPDSKPPSSSITNMLAWLMRGSRDLHYPFLVNWFRNHKSPPVAILADFFNGWTQFLAAQLGIKNLVFSPSGAFAYSVAISLWKDLPEINESDKLNPTVCFPEIPNSPKYPWWQISHLYRNNKAGNPDWDLFRENFLAVFSSWGVVVNSFTELERVYIDFLKTKLGHERVWAVGPGLTQADDVASRGGSSSMPYPDLMTWLDGKSDGSVVYVCFGSRTGLTSKQMSRLALGLELSGVHFIWVVGDPSRVNNRKEVDNVLPEGFEDRTADKGLVIKGWAPQVSILTHKAVGAFLTHCGWNSVLEGISAGVVFLTWPIGADQFTNAQLLVDQLGVGIRVGEDENMLEAEQLGALLADSLKEDRTEKVKVRKLKESSLNAVTGGTSDQDIEELVRSLDELN